MFFQKIRSYVPFLRKSCLPKHKQPQTYDKLDSIVFTFGYLILWRDPHETKLVLFAINCAYWYLTLVYTTWNFYGLVFLTVLLFFLGHTIKFVVWPEIKVPSKPEDHPEDSCQGEWTNLDSNSDNIEEIMKVLADLPLYLKDYYIRLKNLRSSQPGMFCLILCSSFATLTVIGQNIAGLTFLYIITMLTFLPGFCLVYLPPSVVSNALNFLKSFSKSGGSEIDMEEFVPQITEADRTFLDKAAVNTDKSSSGSLLSSLSGSGLSEQVFLPESCEMPGYDEASMDCLDSLAGVEFELSSIERAQLIDQLKEPAEVSDDESSLFKHGDLSGEISSDSDEEKQFCKDLSFSESSSSKPSSNMLTSVIGSAVQNFSALSNSIISNTFPSKSSNIVPSVSMSKLRNVSSSDDDFEIINEDDVS